MASSVPTRARRSARLLGAASLLLYAWPAVGQDAGTPAECAAASVAAPQLQPPRLRESVEAAYPERAKAARLEATVVLRLSIDAEGRVAEVEVTQPAGDGFDQAARAALLRFRFEPAMRSCEPIASRILFAYEFRLPEPAEEDDAGVPFAPEPVVVVSPATQPSAANAATPVEVTVAGARSEGERLQQSAEAVAVIDTHRAKRQTADLGEVLARTQGVAIRRSGGLGSSTRFSLNGLYDDQVRFFLDEIPLDLAGYPFGVVDVPPNLVDRVEVYRGVVPIRFGADALGGAVNLVSDTRYESHAGASYQIGSFGTHRVTLDGRYRDEPTGVIVGAAAFLDLTRNDYDIDVEIPDASGHLHPATVPRFHDGYRAYGGMIEGGVVDRPWAKRLVLRGFVSTYDKELQHNTLMTVPFGEVEYGETVYGATARYEVDLAPHLEFKVVGSYTRRSTDYSDQSPWVYSWTGERVRERRVAGETDVRPHDQTVWQDSAFGRALASWAITPQHTLRASITPSFATRSGHERLQADPQALDPLSAQRDLFTFVSGVEYQLDLFGDRLSNIVFVKDYYYDAKSQEPLAGAGFKQRHTERHRLGFGDSLRFRFTPWLYAKASYEYATRLPRPDEVFGDAILIHENLELAPELSHNLNVGPRVEYEASGFGALTLEVNGFLRETDRLIVLLGNDRFYSYQNVYEARGFGVEHAFNWASPGRYLSLDGTLTWQEVRNTSSEGTFGAFQGDRIPNRPYLFASWGARLRFAALPSSRDVIEPFYIGRYVHGFFRGWESQGLREFKQTVDAQVTHSAGISWTLARTYGRLTTTFEVDNLTNAKLFDNFGVQRPGRAFYLKLTGEM